MRDRTAIDIESANHLLVVDLCSKCGSDGFISDKYCCFWLRFLSLYIDKLYSL